MKISELILRLQSFNPDDEVSMNSGEEVYEIRSIEYVNGDEELRGFVLIEPYDFDVVRLKKYIDDGCSIKESIKKIGYDHKDDINDIMDILTKYPL